jgi:hypothetical protein
MPKMKRIFSGTDIPEIREKEDRNSSASIKPF